MEYEERQRAAFKEMLKDEARSQHFIKTFFSMVWKGLTVVGAWSWKAVKKIFRFVINHPVWALLIVFFGRTIVTLAWNWIMSGWTI